MEGWGFEPAEVSGKADSLGGGLEDLPGLNEKAFWCRHMMACKRHTPHCSFLLLSCGVAFAHTAPSMFLGLSLGAWGSYDRRGPSGNNERGELFHSDTCRR